MSAFEFVLVLYSIIAGIGISAILSGWANQLRSRRRFKPYPLQLAVSAWLLMTMLIYMWVLWSLRAMAWTFPAYLAVAVPILAVSLAAHLVTVDTSCDAPDARSQYFDTSGVLFLLYALVPLTVILASLFLSGVRAAIPRADHFALLTVIRVAVVIGMIVLSRSKSERVHWIGVGLLVLTYSVVIARYMVQVIASSP